MTPKKFPVHSFGYNQAEVDSFLAHIEEEALPAEAVRNKTFATATKGYDKRAVKAYLELLLTEAVGQESREEHKLPKFSTAFQGYSREEVDSYLEARLYQDSGAKETAHKIFHLETNGYKPDEVDAYLEQLNTIQNGGN